MNITVNVKKRNDLNAVGNLMDLCKFCQDFNAGVFDPTHYYIIITEEKPSNNPAEIQTINIFSSDKKVATDIFIFQRMFNDGDINAGGEKLSVERHDGEECL